MSNKKSKKFGRKAREKQAAAKQSWWSKTRAELGTRGPVLLFCVGFIVIMGFYYWWTVQPFFIENIQQPISEVYATVSAGVLGIFDSSAVSHGKILQNDGFAVNISKGCDAIAPIVLLVTGVLLFPARWNDKIIGVLGGTLLLFALNVVRIISLLIIGQRANSWFDFMHEEFWQVVFIGIAVMIWLFWLNWINQKDLKHANAPAV